METYNRSFFDYPFELQIITDKPEIKTKLLNRFESCNSKIIECGFYCSKDCKNYKDCSNCEYSKKSTGLKILGFIERKEDFVKTSNIVTSQTSFDEMISHFQLPKKYKTYKLDNNDREIQLEEFVMINEVLFGFNTNKYEKFLEMFPKYIDNPDDLKFDDLDLNEPSCSNVEVKFINSILNDQDNLMHVYCKPDYSEITETELKYLICDFEIIRRDRGSFWFNGPDCHHIQFKRMRLGKIIKGVNMYEIEWDS
jgi:hypothetical protein